MPDICKVGGKGYALLRMSKSHMPVPDGVILSSDVFDDYISANKLGNPVAYANKHTDYKKLQQKLDKAVLPVYLKNIITQILKEKTLRNKSLAIRSSATVEDSDNASFAGIFKSFINVNSTNDVMDSIKRIYNSAFEEKALNYLHDSPNRTGRLSMAVVIQETIFGDVSGVAFTKDPTNADLFLVESVIGLNDALVSGKITPSSFGIDPKSKKILYKEIRKQRIVQVPDQKHGTRFVTNKSGIEKILTQRDILSLVAKGERLVRLFGKQQDIEWTIRNGKLYILQSRSITADSKPLRLKLNFSGKALSGYAASGGIVKGKVSIINSPKDKTEQGSILVLEATDTDYLPLLRKAKGIITEEGGILSHAAIVSRELNIPCVVGVKQAMGKLKNGSEVALDGTNGLVYIIGSKKEKSKAKPIIKPAMHKDSIDLASLYCIDTAKRATIGSNVFYYEVFDNTVIYYGAEGITKKNMEEYAAKCLKARKVRPGDEIKSYIITGLPVYMKDRKLKETYTDAINNAKKLDPEELKNTFNRIELFAREEKCKANEIKNCTTYQKCLRKFLHYRRANLAYLLVNTILCEGHCVMTLYKNLKPIMEKYNVNFSDLLKSFGSSSTSLPLDISALQSHDLDIINKAAKYYSITKRWKEESYPTYTKLGIAGDKPEKELHNLSKKLNRLGNNCKGYRELFSEAVKSFSND